MFDVVHTVPALFAEDDGILGGAERYVFELARHMADAVRTSLVTFGKRDREERVGKLRIRVIGRPHYVRAQRSNPFATALIGEIRGGRVVHCHQQHIVASTVSSVASRILGRRVFCTDLGGGGWDLSSYVSTDSLYHGHLHISDFSRRVAGHANKDSAHVISGGVDAMKFIPPVEEARPANVLFVGRLLPHKGVDVLLRALPYDMPARIIGGVFDPQQRFTDLRELAVGKLVTFQHDCDDRALVQAYQRASCIVLPSVYDDMYGRHTNVPELLGQTLLEGMACAAPAVCSSVASLPEVVDDGVTGIVVPPNSPDALRDALVRLHASPSRAREMGVAGRERVTTTFTWPAVVERCLELYGLSQARTKRAVAA